MTGEKITDGGSSAIEPQQIPETPDVQSAESQPAPKQRWFQRVTGRGGAWLLPLALSGVTGWAALQWVAGLPPLPECQNPVQLTDASRLYCADRSAQSGESDDLIAALALVSDWGESHPLHGQTQRLMDGWSQSLLGNARAEVESGNLESAIELAEQVPEGSSFYPEAQEFIQDWQQNWDKGADIVQAGRDAIAAQDWGTAHTHVRELVELGSDHWQEQANRLTAEITVEQAAFRELNAAGDIAAYGRVEDLTEAIYRANKIAPERLARQAVERRIDEWSQELLEIAEYFQAIGEQNRAIAAAEQIPPDTSVYAKAQAYVQHSRAQSAAEPGQFWSYVQAWALASQVEAESTLKPEAQTQVQEWQQAIQNLGQIQLAKWFAGFDQIFAYRLAMDHVALVTPEQPRRIEAQTLLANWRNQVDAFTDRQFIARGQQFASMNTLAGLKAALIEVSKIAQGRPLRSQARNLLAEWQAAIERIEDQPILDQARRLAESGDLDAAIQVAERISFGRSLYGDAQAEIGGWVAQIQTVTDRPLLQEADALANQGRLSEAIAVASEISFGRALYFDAQDRIAQWASERDRILAAQRPEPETTQPSTLEVETEPTFSEVLPPEPPSTSESLPTEPPLENSTSPGSEAENF
ncbi:hypothetical protein GS597_06620 [Synechococcales cyanobacterium C]|uniref:Chromosome segregation ATPase n=1 Tax=Petrachloros mirabilis ULC683 TaxID=2781853 RepID=A0A8K1ZY13_9CYAN|nr:hypothetical protein [Petrachloros mirabilis]NCJ06196.1 hypothetical protein [Petrachloros mirabilis ULC683]